MTRQLLVELPEELAANAETEAKLSGSLDRLTP